MECSEVRELLSPMSDREIAPDELRAVEEHLRTCRECAFQSTMILGLKRLLGRWDGVHASENFRTGVLTRVSKEPPPSKFSWRPFALGGTLALVCAVVLVLAIALPVAPEDDARTAAVSSGTEAVGGSAVGATPPSVARPTGGPTATRVGAGIGASGRQTGPPVAQFRTISRAVHLEKPGSPPALAAVGDVVAPGESVRCSEKASARLAIPPANLFLRVEGGAHVTFAQGDFDCELRVGRALFCTKDPGKRPRPFKVRSGVITVELRDSDRALVASLERAPAGTLRIVVAEGEAQILYPGGERELGAAQAVEVGPGGQLTTPPAEADAEELEKLRRWGRP